MVLCETKNRALQRTGVRLTSGLHPSRNLEWGAVSNVHTFTNGQYMRPAPAYMCHTPQYMHANWLRNYITYLFQLGGKILRCVLDTIVHTGKVVPDVWKFAHHLECSSCHEAILNGIPLSGGDKDISAVLSINERIEYFPVFFDGLLEARKRPGRPIFVCSLNEGLSDHTACKKRGAHCPKAKILPVNLFSEAVVWVVCVSILRIMFGIAEKVNVAVNQGARLNTYSFGLRPVESRWRSSSSDRSRRAITELIRPGHLSAGESGHQS